MHLAYNTLLSWSLGRRVPRLPTLLQFCCLTGSSPFRFLKGGVIADVEQAVSWPVDRLAILGEPRRKLPNDSVLRRSLEEVLLSDEDPPPSMYEVARRLGHDPRSINGRLPHLCRQISARYLAHRQAMRLRREQARREAIRRAVYSIHAEGKYPSSLRVSDQLGSPCLMMNREARVAWREALEELCLR